MQGCPASQAQEQLDQIHPLICLSSSGEGGAEEVVEVKAVEVEAVVVEAIVVEAVALVVEVVVIQ